MAGHGMIGMDPGAAETLVGKLTRAAEALQGQAVGITAAVNQLAWRGPAAQRFVSQWNEAAAKRINLVVAELRSHASRLESEISQQRMASSVTIVAASAVGAVEGSAVRDRFGDVRREYFRNSDAGAAVTRPMSTGASTPGQGNGIIVVVLFIEDETVAGNVKGDGRKFNVDPNLGYRMAIAWDTETGEVVGVAQPSHVRLPRPYPRFEPGFPIPRIEGPSLTGDWKRYDVFDINKGKGNSIDVEGRSFTGGAQLNVDYFGTINRPGHNFMFPSIDGTIGIRIEGDQVRVESDRNDFPSLQVVQYREGLAPRFLAKDGQGHFSRLTGIGSNERKTWHNGVLVP